MILGIDTSNYTTSLAAVENGQIMFDGRKPETGDCVSLRPFFSI